MTSFDMEESKIFKPEDFPLRSLLNHTITGKVQLPDFQRGWVWEDQHIKDLLVSISKSFPIGAIMLLESGEKTNFKFRPVDGTSFSERIEPKYLILDGQQRLTALTQAINSKDPVITENEQGDKIELYYYIDINKVLEGGEIEETIISVDSNRQIKFGHNIKLDLSTTEKECDEFYFPCNQILNSDMWERCLNEKFNEKINDFMKFRMNLLNRFRYYSIPAIVLVSENSKEAVCQVFERVNTRGMKLTVFDIVTASIATGEFSLREDWYGNEEMEIEGIRNRLHCVSTLKSIEPTDFLQGISLLYTLKQRNDFIEKQGSESSAPAVSANRDAILKLTSDIYCNNKSDVENGFILVADFLRRQCIFSEDHIPYQTQLITIASALSRLQDCWQEHRIYNKIRKLFWCGVLGELYKGQTESRMAFDLEDLLIWIDDDSRLPRSIRDIRLSENRLYSLKTRGSAAFKGLLSLIISEGALDFYMDAHMRDMDFESQAIDIHHIFPKKWCKDNIAKLNIKLTDCDSIINKTPISKFSNLKIGSDAPSEYLMKIQDRQNITQEKMDKILVSHGITPKYLRNDDFVSFFNERKKYLIKLIEKTTGLEVFSSTPKK